MRYKMMSVNCLNEMHVSKPNRDDDASNHSVHNLIASLRNLLTSIRYLASNEPCRHQTLSSNILLLRFQTELGPSFFTTATRTFRNLFRPSGPLVGSPVLIPAPWLDRNGPPSSTSLVARNRVTLLMFGSENQPVPGDPTHDLCF